MSRPSGLVLIAGVLLLAALLLPRLGHPLFWNDEGETVMYGARVLEYGFPKVHGPRNTVYELDIPKVGIRRDSDAFVGSPWLQYYLAAVGVWLAGTDGDPYERTAWVRLPFAATGLLGVLLWGLAIATPLPRRQRLLVVGVVLLLACASTSLLLHVREARYYAPTVCLLGGLAYLYLGFRSGRVGPRACAIGMSILLVALFHTFLLGFASFCVAVVLDQAIDVARTRRIERSRLLPVLLPVVIAGLLAIPGLWFYRTLALGRLYGSVMGSSGGVFLWNALQAILHLARHELLVPASLALVIHALLPRKRSEQNGVAPVDPAMGAVRFLSLLVVVHVLLVARLPWYYTRYIVALSLPLIGILVLAVAASWRPWRGASPSLRAATGAVLALTFLGVTALRMPETLGRIAELRDPVRGPIDHVVTHLLERYEDPSRLVIATNYESTPLMFYLGSQLMVGYTAWEPPSGNERLELPDVVIPRRTWPRNMPYLQWIVDSGSYEIQTLPVGDWPTNTSPELSSPAQQLFGWGMVRGADGRMIRLEHRFQNDVPDEIQAGRLRVFHRREYGAGAVSAEP